MKKEFRIVTVILAVMMVLQLSGCSKLFGDKESNPEMNFPSVIIELDGKNIENVKVVDEKLATAKTSEDVNLEIKPKLAGTTDVIVYYTDGTIEYRSINIDKEGGVVNSSSTKPSILTLTPKIVLQESLTDIKSLDTSIVDVELTEDGKAKIIGHRDGLAEVEFKDSETGRTTIMFFNCTTTSVETKDEQGNVIFTKSTSKTVRYGVLSMKASGFTYIDKFNPSLTKYDDERIKVISTEDEIIVAAKVEYIDENDRSYVYVAQDEYYTLECGICTYNNSLSLYSLGVEDKLAKKMLDICMSDGTFIHREDYAEYKGKAKPVGIVVYNYGERQRSGYMLGIINSYDTKYSFTTFDSPLRNKKIDEIYWSREGGDEDGSDNWEIICQKDPVGTKDPATNYPAFNYALNYGKTAGLQGTKYETGWYIPSAWEIGDICNGRNGKTFEALNEILEMVGGVSLADDWYMTSTEYRDIYSSVLQYGYKPSTDQLTNSIGRVYPCPVLVFHKFDAF